MTNRIELVHGVVAVNGKLFNAWNQEFKNCDNPACDRLVAPGNGYCCAGCSVAHLMRCEAHEGGDVISHSDGCTTRHNERQAAVNASKGVA